MFCRAIDSAVIFGDCSSHATVYKYFKGKDRVHFEGPIKVTGGSLPCVDVTYEQWGDPTLPPDRTVSVLALCFSSDLVLRWFEC